MGTLKRFAGILGSVLTLAALAQPANATSYVGTFANPGDVALINFSVAGLNPATVTFQTFSYAGGTNGAGNLIASGGFDPVVTIYTRPAGDYVAWNDDGGDAGLRGEGGRRRERAALGQQRLDRVRLLRHHRPPCSFRMGRRRSGAARRRQGWSCISATCREANSPTRSSAR